MQPTPPVRHLALGLSVVLALLAMAAPAAEESRPSPHRVILVTLDGARIEEIFGGVDEEVARAFARSRGTELEGWPLYRTLRAPTAQARRRRLMPFFWGTLMARHGSIAGNPARGSRVRFRNRFGYSYPGYAEMLTGRPHDDTIVSNDEQASPASTILEQTASELGLARGQVAVFASWSRFRGIAERRANTILIDAGPSAPIGTKHSPFPDLRRDEETIERALAHLRSRSPRFLHLALGETDDWAHEGRYDRVLEALRLADDGLRRIWEFVETDPSYAGRTCIVVTTDHGRGRGPEAWRHHGPGVAGTEDVWMALVSPDSSRRGEWVDEAPLELGQTAPTIAAWLGVSQGDSLLAPIDGVVGSGASRRTMASRWPSFRSSGPSWACFERSV